MDKTTIRYHDFLAEICGKIGDINTEEAESLFESALITGGLPHFLATLGLDELYKGITDEYRAPGANVHLTKSSKLV